MLDRVLLSLRILACLTVLEVSRELRVSPGVVHRWERGEAVPRRAHLAALMRLYQASPEARDDVAHLAAFGERR
jgi:transcriptional regulator with XRE-family HTH domain